MKLAHQLILYTKINSRWIKDLNIRCNTIKVIEENIGRKISDIPPSNIFTDMSPGARDIKERINKWDFIKIKSFYMAEENISKMKKGNQLYWKIYFENDTLDKDLISKIYKELTQLHSRKTNNPIKKLGKGPEQILLQGGHTQGPETYEKMLSITSIQRDTN